MNSRRHNAIILLLMASVFFFLSGCGIPTYYVPERAELVKGTKNESGGISFTLTYQAYETGEGVDRNSIHVELLLLYCSDSDNSDKIKKAFENTYIQNQIDGIPLIEDNGKVTLDGSDVYIFKSADSNPSGAQNYTYKIDGDGSYSFNLKCEKKNDSTSATLTCFKGNSDQGEVKKLTFTGDLNNGIRVFGAISVQPERQYSNVYWTKLVDLGVINRENL